MPNKARPEVGIVVPTLGSRPDYLLQTLRSIRASGDSYVLLVSAPGFDAEKLLTKGLIDEYQVEQQRGLAAAINQGLFSMPESVKYINWIGDDDLYEPGAINLALERIKQPDRPVMVFGACQYVDAEGNDLFLNKSGQWAATILPFGPQLIPQPGALFRRDAFDQLKGLDTKYGWAFDFDLFLKFKRLGKLVYLPATLSRFRWHAESLSVGQRKNSALEASRVRRSHLPAVTKPLSILWEVPLVVATLVAGRLASRRAIATQQT